MTHFDETESKKRLASFRVQEEEDLAKMLSSRHGVGYVDLTTAPVKTDALKLIPEVEARKWKVATFDIVGKNVAIGVLSPAREETQNVINMLRERGYNVEVFIVTQRSLDKAWSRYVDVKIATESSRGLLKISGDEIERILKDVHSPEEVHDLIQETVNERKSHQISSIVEIIIAGAIALKASDIHIEPAEEVVGLRIRLDGLLTPIADFDYKTFKLLSSRLKLLSGIKINVKKEAQDGRFSIKIQDRDIEIRSSVIPGAYGESIVLRILDPAAIKLTLEEIGMGPHIIDIMKKEISRPHGLILNTGPTGSGKSTTLYAFLEHIFRPDIKIVTIEDPIEYHINGITQTQVDESRDYTFATGLSSTLRQDPDVVMVGEIRDNQTADTAFQAALTGHLVFSTLHTNSAAGTFPRLLELDVNPNLFGPAISMVMAQRLVRILCPETKIEVPITDKEKELIEKIISKSARPDLFEPYMPLTKLYKPGSSETCPTGYRGRIGIFEAIVMNPEIAKLIKEEASEEMIQAEARKQKMVTLAEDGILKVLKGVTDLAELSRIVDLTE